MHFATHKTLSWLLMLALVIGPMQGVRAMDMSQATMSAACLKMMGADPSVDSRTSDLGQASCAQPSSPDHCPDMDGCTGFSSFNTVALASAPLVAHALVLRTRLSPSDARLSTRYPELLQRPPQI